MMLWIRLALRNAFRNFRRTLLTAGTILAATALLVTTLSWTEGVLGGMISSFVAQSGQLQVLDAEFAAKEELHPLYAHLKEVDPLLKALKSLPHVTDVQARVTVGVALSTNELIGDDFAMVVGASPGWYQQHLQPQAFLDAGSWMGGASHELLLGRKLAKQINAKPGDKVLLLGQTHYGSMSPINATLVGIVSGDSGIEQQAFASLEVLQELVDIPGGALEVLVYSDRSEVKDLIPLADQARNLPALKGLMVRGWWEREPWANIVSVMGVIKAFIQGLVVFIASLAIFNTMTMSVLERTAEIGVMRAMGLTRLGALGLFVVESLAIGLLGGIGGAVLGGAAGLYLERTGVTLAPSMIDKVGADFPMHPTMYGNLTWYHIQVALVFGLIMAVTGAILPALRAASIQPVVAMRARK